MLGGKGAAGGYQTLSTEIEGFLTTDKLSSCEARAAEVSALERVLLSAALSCGVSAMMVREMRTLAPSTERATLLELMATTAAKSSCSWAWAAEP